MNSSPRNGVVSFVGGCGREVKVQMNYEAYFLQSGAVETLRVFNNTVCLALNDKIRHISLIKAATKLWASSFSVVTLPIFPVGQRRHVGSSPRRLTTSACCIFDEVTFLFFFKTQR
jgi:hypothetical protein